MSKAAKTSMEPVALSAMETLISEEQRLYNDPLSVCFLTPSMKFYLLLCRCSVMLNWIIKTSETMMPGAYAGVLARKIYMENKFEEYHTMVSDVVELGAGFDTFSLRLHDCGDHNFFELDFCQNIQAKAKTLNHQKFLENKRINLCAIDFDKENIQDVLSQSGFVSEKAVFVVWEGVTQYLTEHGIHRTFQWLKTLPKNSCIGFTYVADEFINGKNLMGWEALYKKYVKTGVWKTGFNTKKLTKLLQSHGWELQEDCSASEILSVQILNKRKLKTSDVERMAFAIKL